MSPASPPASQADLEALEAAIAPLRLPTDVRRFWQLVDPFTLGVETWPEIHPPDFALQCWQANREVPGIAPDVLLQVASTSHSSMLVELENGTQRGGALFETYVPDGGFVRRFNGLGDWLAYVAGLVEAGCFREERNARGHYLLVPDPAREEEEEQSRTPPPDHAVYGATLIIEPDVLDWPEHWQRATGLQAADLVLRGATATVSGLLSSTSASDVRATIVARVVRLTGSAAWTRVTVDDGTGLLDVECPVATTLLGPVIDDWFEFDIVVAAGGCQAIAEAVRRVP